MLILIRCCCYTKIRVYGLIPLELFPFVILEKARWFLLLALLNNFRNLHVLCINVDIDELLLLDKTKNLEVNFLRVISLCNS